MKLNKQEKQFLLGLLQDAKTQTINNCYETTLWYIEKTINEDAFHELKKAYDKKAKLITSLEAKIEGNKKQIIEEKDCFLKIIQE